MKKFIFLIIIIRFIATASTQETNGQFRERVYQINDRFDQHWERIHRKGYYESVDFNTYVDEMAKAAAYAEFLSESLDKIAQIYSSFLSREALNAHRKRADTLYEISEDLDKWADDLTEKLPTDPDELKWLNERFTKEQIEEITSHTWKDAYYSRKSTFYRYLTIWERSRL
jgi:hypothetical protein